MRNTRLRWRATAALATLLVAATPAIVLAKAKSPLAATAVMTPGDGSQGWSIDAGNVSEAGNSGRFVVRDRTVTGVFVGDVNGPFSFTYGSNVPLLTQSGQFNGTLEVGAYEAQVRGASDLVAGPLFAYVPGIQLPGLPASIAVVLEIQLSGGFTFTDGAGHGSLNGVFTVAIDPAAGHILFLVPSFLPLLDPTTLAPVGYTNTSVDLSGQWSK